METFVADQIFIDAASDRVFAALIEPEDILVWFDAVKVRLAPAVGGELELRFTSGATLAARVAALDPDRRLVLDEVYITEDGVARGPTVLSFEVSPHDFGVWLLARHSELDFPAGEKVAGSSDRFAQQCRARLVAATVALKRHVEGI